MDRWTFNKLLFSSLTSVLDLSIMEMAKRVEIGQQTLNRYINCKNELPVDILIQICNHLRMPSYFFVSENGNYDIPNRETATIAADQWQPVTWDEQAVEHTFGDGGGRIFWKDVAVVMDVTPQKPHNQFLLRRRFTVVDFLKVCSHFNLSPFLFLVDRNRDDGKKKSRKAAVPCGTSPTLLAEITAMRRQMVDLAEKYQNITEKYDNLLEAYQTLLRRFNEHVNDSYIGIAADNG